MSNVETPRDSESEPQFDIEDWGHGKTVSYWGEEKWIMFEDADVIDVQEWV